jgi:hypothetical protein
MKYIRLNAISMSDRKIILYSHGNAIDIGQMHLFLTKLSQEIDVDVIAYDYPGYGLSEGGHASAEGCTRFIFQVYEYLLKLGYDTENILLCDTSIGTGPTVNLAVAIPGLKGCHALALHECLQKQVDQAI